MQLSCLLLVPALCTTIAFWEMKQHVLGYRRSLFASGRPSHAWTLETWEKNWTIHWANTWPEAIIQHRVSPAMIFLACQPFRLNWIYCQNLWLRWHSVSSIMVVGRTLARRNQVCDRSITHGVHHVRVCRLTAAAVKLNDLKCVLNNARKTHNQPPPKQHVKPNPHYDWFSQN